jgi:chorismate synthase
MEWQIRELHGFAEFERVEQLQGEIWGDPHDIMPARSMMAMVHEGALLAGSFLQGEMLGFVFGFPTGRPGRHHSHMMGVVEHHRGSRAALLLKYFQRDWALAHGYEQVAWTFDPLRGINASFNLRKLGATFNQYIPDCYGEMSGINAGAPSDRADVDWNLRAERVYTRLYAPPPTPEIDDLPQINLVVDQRPLGLSLNLPAPRLLLQIPEDWGQILASDRQLALEWRLQTREAFVHFFAQGYRATEFVRFPNRYLLERTEV